MLRLARVSRFLRFHGRGAGLGGFLHRILNGLSIIHPGLEPLRGLLELFRANFLLAVIRGLLAIIDQLGYGVVVLAALCKAQLLRLFKEVIGGLLRILSIGIAVAASFPGFLAVAGDERQAQS